MQGYLKALLKLLVVILVLALIAGVVLYFAQGFFVYTGRNLQRGDSVDWQARLRALSSRGLRAFDIEGPAGARVKGLQISAQASPAPVVLWFHARGENISEVNPTTSLLTQAGCGVYLMQYRSYGQSPGEPAQADVLADAEALFDHVMGKPDLLSGGILAGGTEWGATVAFMLSTRREVSSVIALSPIPDMATAVRGTFRWAPWGILLKENYELMPVLPAVKVPVFLARGADDTLVPPSTVANMRAKIPTAVTEHVVTGAGRENLIDRGGRPLLEALTLFVTQGGR